MNLPKEEKKKEEKKPKKEVRHSSKNYSKEAIEVASKMI